MPISLGELAEAIVPFKFYIECLGSILLCQQRTKDTPITTLKPILTLTIPVSVSLPLHSPFYPPHLSLGPLIIAWHIGGNSL